jgi:Protein of unknown function (DUF3738)
MTPTISILTLVPLMAPTLGIAQPNPTFEAASIKPDKQCPGPYGRGLPGRIVMNCYSIQELAAFAWGVRKEQVVGQFFPDRYDIEATMDGAAPSAQIIDRMLQALTLKALADSLSRTELNRTVVDKTGVAGAFDVTLHWETNRSDPLYDGIGGAPSSEPGEGPSLFTAIEEQLGLKLQASRGPDEVLVIDQVEKPGQ